MEQIPQKAALAGRFIMGVVGFAFAGIGLTVLGFLWFGDDGFGSPPLIFRLVGSFIAIVFVVFGGTMGLSAVFARGLMADPTERLKALQGNAGAETRVPGSYVCPNCGATLGNAEVSPLGDVKCTFCGSWFNIHSRK